MPSSLARAGSARAARAEPSSPLLAAIGSVTGFSSALTGTGGPLVLVPILVGLELPVHAAVGIAQAIQLPIAVFATAGHAASGVLDPALGALLGLGIGLGTFVGARIAHALPGASLRTAVSAALVLVGGAMLLGAAFPR
jgi:hypothetical protein